MDCQLEFVERARVDEMNGDSEGDAQYYTQQSQDETPEVLAQRAGGYCVACESERDGRHQPASCGCKPSAVST